MFTAFSISSTPISTRLALRRASTPYTPIPNSRLASSNGHHRGISDHPRRVVEVRAQRASKPLPVTPLRQHDRADKGGEQQDAEHLERQHPDLEDRLPGDRGRDRK